MDKNYLALLTEVVHIAELAAEQVMELNKNNNDINAFRVATTMRNDYAALYDKMRMETCTLSKQDYAKILAATLIASEQLEKRINNENKVLCGYKDNIIPKLDRILGCKDDESAQNLAEEIFQLNI